LFPVSKYVRASVAFGEQSLKLTPVFFDLAQEIPGKLLTGKAPVTHLEIAGVMDAVLVSSGSTWTIETMVADLVKGIVYVYFFYQYDRPLVLNVRQKLANPREPGPLSMLFPHDVPDEAARRYKVVRMNVVVGKLAGISWPALMVLSLILPGKEGIVNHLLPVYEAETYQTLRFNHIQCSSTRVTFLRVTHSIIEIVNGCQRLEIGFVHVTLILLSAGARKGEGSVTKHRKIVFE
jgi:hypothetical protein